MEYPFAVIPSKISSSGLAICIYHDKPLSSSKRTWPYTNKTLDVLSSVLLVMTYFLLNFNAHIPRCTFNNLHRPIYIIGIQVFHFNLSNLSYLSFGNFADFFLIGFAGTLFSARRLTQKKSRWRSFQNKAKTAVFVNSHLNRHNFTLFFFGSIVKLFYEIGNVNAVRPQSRAYRRRRRRFAAIKLKF